jgi:hypothetical protein
MPMPIRIYITSSTETHLNCPLKVDMKEKWSTDEKQKWNILLIQTRNFPTNYYFTQHLSIHMKYNNKKKNHNVSWKKHRI